MYKLKDLSIKDQAYFIIITFNGSWLYEALYEELKSEELCKKIVDNYVNEYGYGEGHCDREVADSYPQILAYRASKVV